MIVTFTETEICRIVAYYAEREMNHSVPWDEVTVTVTGKGEDRQVTASYEVGRFTEEEKDAT
jgi:hypothetical protein